MKSFTLASALAYAGGVAAFWRMPCRSVTGYGRVDPIVDPNQISGHVHAITGSSGFSPSATYADLVANDTCTACSVTQDHSAYWTPALYFQHANGTTVLVEQVGGMLAYYLYYLDNVKAFPEGFVMLAGNVNQRNFTGPEPDEPLSYWPTYPSNQFWLSQRAIGFNCLNYAKDPEASLFRHQFPNRTMLDNECTDGVRFEMAFPSCGKEGVLDSEDHQSHVAYPSLVKEGNCPEGYDVHYPFLFYETIWATNQFAGVDGHFMLSNGDPTGTSYHGDFMMGWKSSDFLQKALDNCKNPSGRIEDCDLFTIQGDDECAQCNFNVPENVAHDDCHGPREGLPVDVPVQWGPEPATKYNVAGNMGSPTTGLKPSAAPTLYHQSAVPYSPANPASTSAAQGGIVVAAELKSAEAPASSVTSAPAYAATEEASKSASTTYITKGYEVIEMVIEETEVTVTAVPTPGSYKHKRHLEKHQHHHHMH